jgi:hypothetical protein
MVDFRETWASHGALELERVYPMVQRRLQESGAGLLLDLTP